MVADEFMRLNFFFLFYFYLFFVSFFRAIAGVWEFETFVGEVFLGGEVR